MQPPVAIASTAPIPNSKPNSLANSTPKFGVVNAGKKVVEGSKEIKEVYEQVEFWRDMWKDYVRPAGTYIPHLVKPVYNLMQVRFNPRRRFQ
jgi:hypothetical protein